MQADYWTTSTFCTKLGKNEDFQPALVNTVHNAGILIPYILLILSLNSCIPFGEIIGALNDHLNYSISSS